jgi:hypothetical protein
MFNSINSLFDFKSKKTTFDEKGISENDGRRVSFVENENLLAKRRNTYAEHYLEIKRAGSLATPVKFYTELQRKGKFFFIYSKKLILTYCTELIIRKIMRKNCQKLFYLRF